MAAPRIVFYATGSCPHCEAMRAALRASGEPFEERDPLSSPDALRALLSCGASGSVPTVVVGGQVLVGFDPERLEEILREPAPPAPPVDDDIPDELPGPVTN